MLQVLFSLAIAPFALSATPALPAGTQLTYQGSVEATDEASDGGKKTFDLTLWTLSKDGANTDLFWLVDERGNGEFPWPSRFGRADLDAGYRTSHSPPALLYDRGDGMSIIDVHYPFLTTTEPLSEGTTFSDGKYEYRVEKEVKHRDQPAWLISVRNAFGPKRTLVVSQAKPIVLEMEERLTMGRGEPFRLKLELIGSEQLAEENLASLKKAVTAANSLRDRLNLPSRTREIQWKPEQTEQLTRELPPLLELTAGTPLSKLVSSAKRDLDLQAGRNDAVAALQTRFVDKPVDNFFLRGTAGEKLSADDLKNNVTVLHFWDYRDEPLHEPYGQVGYLDFVYHRRKNAGLRVYGVAVNPRLGDESTRGAAERSAKKLKSFMNLSYPILLDDGTLLRQFGDPRVIGASLPLFVVVGPEGHIIHYHVGTYDVQQDQGLKELDDFVSPLLQKN